MVSMKLNFVMLFIRCLSNFPTNKLIVGALLTSLFLLTGCESPVKKETEYTTREIVIQRADKLISQARQASSPERDQLMLQAAEIYFQQGYPNRANEAISAINKTQLALQPLAQYSLLGADLALLNDDFFAAREFLTNFTVERSITQLPITVQQRWYSQRAQLFDLLGEDQLSLTEYLALSATLTDPQEISATHEKLWGVLSRISSSDLQQQLSTEQNQINLGWLQLADISRNSQGDMQQLQKNIGLWYNTWNWHPAAMYPPASLAAISNIADSLPKNIALLLPLSGRLGASGKTTRDGFLSAYYQVLQHGSTPPHIRIYDTISQPDITTLYQQAVTDGAELVLGPLYRPNVEALNQLGDLPVPTITLNYLPSDTTPVAANLYQFGLSTTDEARQVAQRAWLDGHRRAITIMPDSSLGQRIFKAFEQEWSALGGDLVASGEYKKDQVDFTTVIKPLLLIDQSLARTKRLQKTLNLSIQTGPERRRFDADMVFIQASPTQGRQIKPMLDYFYAGDLPVYATSQIYTGRNDPGKDRDLDKIMFAAMPWTLPNSDSSSTKPDANLHPSYQQIFALGVDAYQVHQGIRQLEIIPAARLYGSTGTLRLEQGKVLRQQPWAEFRYGKVQKAKTPTTH
jgi:outer membrane PBP1 activator LpoA protein